jgi:hypothetical protein
MPSPKSIEAALTALQRAMRRPPRDGRPALTRTLPEELQRGDLVNLSLLQDEAAAFAETKALLLADLRFEHLERTVDDVVWQFAAQAFTNRSEDYVPEFVQRHRRELVETTCFIPVEYLKVEAEIDALGLTLLPLTDDRVPTPDFGFSLAAPVASVAAVRVTGTNFDWMASRGRVLAEHALRLLRVALRGHLWVVDRQLRFRLGHSYTFREGHGGWQQGPDAAYELEFGGDLITLVDTQAVGQLPFEPSNRLERKAMLATRWIERAMFASEPLVAVLYTFFALEALLGDKAEGLKAPALALRRAMLGEATGAGFVNPSETFFLYDKVRSAAVHGEDVPETRSEAVHSFTWDVRRALNQYLDYARAEGFTRQSQLVRALDAHADRPNLIAWLRLNGGSAWTKYLEGIAPVAGPAPGTDGAQSSASRAHES